MICYDYDYRARQTLPSEFAVIDEEGGGTNVVCVKDVDAKTRFGPLVAPVSNSQSDHCLVNSDHNLKELDIIAKEGQRVKLDLTNENQCNWLCLIALAKSKQEQNCMIYQMSSDIYFTTMRAITSGEVLKAWYATGYARKFGAPEEPVTTIISLTEVEPHTDIMETEEIGSGGGLVE